MPDWQTVAHDDSGTALREAERLQQAVEQKSARWYSRYFTLTGVAMFGVFCVYALPPGPWMWAVFAVVMAGLLIFFWRYERSQLIRRHASMRRFWTAFTCYLALVLALLVARALLFEQTPTWWFFATAATVAVPFFVAAALERRSVAVQPRDGGFAA